MDSKTVRKLVELYCNVEKSSAKCKPKFSKNCWVSESPKRRSSRRDPALSMTAAKARTERQGIAGGAANHSNSEISPLSE